MLTVPSPPILKIYAAIRLAANTGFIFHIPYERKLSTGYIKQNHLLAEVAATALMWR